MMSRAAVELRSIAAVDFPSIIFTSSAVSTIKRLGRRGDCGRAMLELTEEALLSAGGAPELAKVLRALSTLCRLLSSALGMNYEPVKPLVLIFAPGAAEQRPHTDACPPSLVIDPPRMLGVLRDVEPDTRLPSWPGSYNAVLGGAKSGGGASDVVHFGVGELFVCRGDTAHCGAANPSATPPYRVHSYFISTANRSDFQLKRTYSLPKWTRPLPKPRQRRSSPCAA